jgi:wyosine [tRNA(Phe)-imidazoG37] synthetase (radical SAM superfamily)
MRGMSDEQDIRQAAKRVPVVQDHSRLWHRNRYVYPVISRRARGLSIGINLNPEQACTFNCVYCEVNRRQTPGSAKVELGVLIRELNEMLDFALGGTIWKDSHFAAVPDALRRINDIAFSGDGEPTAFRNFADAVQVAADAKAFRKLRGVKLVVISNATRFHTQTFRRALPTLQAGDGEIWAKLDAGSSEHFARVNRTRVPFKQVLDNIQWLSREMPLVIQTCFFRLDGQAPNETEIELYIARLRHVLAGGGNLLRVQLYTVARPPAERGVAALSDNDLDNLTQQIQHALPNVPVEVYYGADVPPQDELI